MGQPFIRLLTAIKCYRSIAAHYLWLSQLFAYSQPLHGMIPGKREISWNHYHEIVFNFLVMIPGNQENQGIVIQKLLTRNFKF